MIVDRRSLAVAAAPLLLAAGAVAATTHLKSSLPSSGATVAAAPTELRFSFDESMKPKGTAVTLTGSAGRVPLAAATLAADDDKTVVVPVAGPLTPGSYKVDWHALATDGRRTSGSYRFTIIP